MNFFQDANRSVSNSRACLLERSSPNRITVIVNALERVQASFGFTFSRACLIRNKAKADGISVRTIYFEAKSTVCRCNKQTTINCQP